MSSIGDCYQCWSFWSQSSLQDRHSNQSTHPHYWFNHQNDYKISFSWWFIMHFNEFLCRTLWRNWKTTIPHSLKFTSHMSIQISPTSIKTLVEPLKNSPLFPPDFGIPNIFCVFFLSWISSAYIWLCFHKDTRFRLVDDSWILSWNLQDFTTKTKKFFLSNFIHTWFFFVSLSLSLWWSHF